MQFAFTEEQDLLRREAREVLANGGWGRDELDELAFLDRAVVFEEAGRANRGVEHAKSREQFGRPIGVYQAVAHPLADTYVDTELARSIAYWAAWCVAEDDEQAPIAAAAAKSYAGEVAVLACERAIQVLGGIGFTWEHVLHRYYKRALWIQAHGGYPRELRAKVAAWLLD
jgi:alkylation response protein AidB-like acyl-CoA dehydrogenase